MGLVIDDTSLILLIAIVALLLFSAISSRWYLPSIHPLILGRQSDVSRVRNKGESPIYRNVNSPHGFDLATRPKKGVYDVRTLLTIGNKGDEAELKRSLYGQERSNADVLSDAQRFGRGFLHLSKQSSSTLAPSLAVCVEADHLESLEATLAGAALADPKTGQSPIATLVVPPLHLPDGQPEALPALSKRPQRLAVVYTTAAAIHKAVAMPIVDAQTVFVVRDADEVVKAADKAKERVGAAPRLMTFAELLDLGAGNDSTDAEQQPDAAVINSAVQASFWLGSHWTHISNQSLCAGVTTYLSFYPADGVPTSQDRILIEQSSFTDSPSVHLGAAATPAGLTLALTALFTGASLHVAPLTSSLDDANPSAGSALRSLRPTILYSSPQGGSSLGLALAATARRSSLAAFAYSGKLRALRHGTLSPDSMWDSLLFKSVRAKSGTERVRALTIIGQGWVVGQTLLDVLRVHLGSPVMNAYLPESLALLPHAEPDAHDDPAAVSLTAPLSASHALDVQAFRANNGISELPAHVGPPGVSVEVKLVGAGSGVDAQSAPASADSTPHGWERFTGKDDPLGSVALRGTTATLPDSSAAQVSDETWYVPATASPAAFRSNGVLLLLPPSIHDEKKRMVPIPSMSSKFPIQGGAIIGSGPVQGSEKEGQAKKNQ